MWALMASMNPDERDPSGPAGRAVRERRVWRGVVCGSRGCGPLLRRN